MMDKRISETDLVLPALYIISKEGSMTTSQLISRLAELLKPIGKDAEILKNRHDTHFSQLVRNLVSHRTLEKLEYASYERKSRSGIHTITENGRKFLELNQDTLEYLFGEDFNYEDFNYEDIKDSLADMAEKGKQKKKAFIYDENLVVTEGRKRKKDVQVYERSKKLREVAVNHYLENGHLKCCICSFDFYAHYGEKGRGFIEIHHQKPLFQYEDEDMSRFIARALQNVVPVCSNCHRMIHREKNAPMPIEDLKRLVEKYKGYPV